MSWQQLGASFELVRATSALLVGVMKEYYATFNPPEVYALEESDLLPGATSGCTVVFPESSHEIHIFPGCNIRLTSLRRGEAERSKPVAVRVRTTDVTARLRVALRKVVEDASRYAKTKSSKSYAVSEIADGPWWKKLTDYQRQPVVAAKKPAPEAEQDDRFSLIELPEDT